MKVLAVLAAAVAGVSAYQDLQNHTTVLPNSAIIETVEEYVTVVPNATTFRYGNQVVEATAGETVTITDCPCQVVRPVTIVSTVVCTTSCTNTPTAAFPTGSAPAPTSPVVGTGTTSRPTTAPTLPPPIPTAAATKLTGLGLAGLLGFVVLAL